ncbi:YiiX/YebB-like N1pC/P60 family cysteine hydrolase [Agrobacterium radiobacter]|uniref:YiiX/YebB-like N1pC/P60 family cysteine hydrolase n=1 Tax=Agrobacterium radiobacter TaxID=362 RepID=UPI003F828031
MKRINDRILEPGDIILTTSRAKISKAIRLATRSDISHAMVCVEGYSVIDATADGVHARNTQRLFYDLNDAVHVLRLKRGLTKHELNAVIMYMRGHIGSRYSTREAVLTGLGRHAQPSRKQFCSRLVAQAFKSSGIALVTNPDFCSPEQLRNNDLLTEVPEPTVEMTDEEAAQWADRPDGTQLMRDVTNTILSGARARNPLIETFDDIDNHLKDNPEDDGLFSQLLEVSGYLSLWQIEQRKNPWLYDLSLMEAAPFEEMKAYCESTVADEGRTSNRYIVNRGGYALFAKQYGLRYFILKADLYDLLAAMHLQRIRVASAWLERQGLISPSPTSYITPHTPEWFVSMQQWDPVKAMMTAAAIKIEGSTEICSICGDVPASDYVLRYEHRTLGGPGTLRLCDECLVIQNGGDNLFEPM